MATQRRPVVRAEPSYEHGKQIAQRIFLATMAKLDVRRAMLGKMRREDGKLVAGNDVVPFAKPPYVVAFGKAAVRMAAALNEILGGEVAAGVVVAPVAPPHRLDRFEYYEAGHPYPTVGSIGGASAALELVSGLDASDLVIFLVSGGGSALFEKPLDANLTVAELVEFNRVLVTGSLPIEQMNVLRKHLSAVKAGRLAARAFPARQLTIYISDVPEQFPSMVASGPTLPDESTVDQCYDLAERAGLLPKLPPRIRQRFESHSLEETPKQGDEVFSRSTYFCLSANRDAVEAARDLASEAGFQAEIDRGTWDADYQVVVERVLQSLDERAAKTAGRPVCLVMGGEVICAVTGHGVGGRNLSLALYAALKIQGRRRVVLSAATDGRDGNSPSSGAVADGHTVARAVALGLDPQSYLSESDAYHFFRALGDTIETGFTDNNVRDLRLLMSFD